MRFKFRSRPGLQSSNTVAVSWGWLCPSGDIWQCLKTYLIITKSVVCVLSASREWRSEMLLNLPQRTRELNTQKWSSPKWQECRSWETLVHRLDWVGRTPFWGGSLMWLVRAAGVLTRWWLAFPRWAERESKDGLQAVPWWLSFWEQVTK